jgi:hypothetical protein
MDIVVARNIHGQAVAFEVDGEPIEIDASSLAEASIGGASGSAATSAAGAVTLNNASAGMITTESVSTAAGGTYSLTITSNLIRSTSLVMATVTLGTSTTGAGVVSHVTPAAGSVNVKVQNIHASAAFNGTLKIGFAIFQ